MLEVLLQEQFFTFIYVHNFNRLVIFQYAAKFKISQRISFYCLFVDTFIVRNFYMIFASFQFRKQSPHINNYQNCFIQLKLYFLGIIRISFNKKVLKIEKVSTEISWKRLIVSCFRYGFEQLQLFIRLLKKCEPFLRFYSMHLI